VVGATGTLIPCLYDSKRLARDLAVYGLLALILSVLILSPALITAFSGYGGYISEQTLGDGTNENQYLGDGSNYFEIVGSGPAVSTQEPTVGVEEATLKGTVDSLNGMEEADVWFEWGYSPSGPKCH